MKLRILSDLHVEHDPTWTLRHFGETAILCAGDLGNRRCRDRTEKLIRNSRVPFYYVLGNHDFYHGEVGEVIEYYQFLAKRVEHFHFLHNTTMQLGEYVLAGTPLWTDFSLFGRCNADAVMAVAENVINDFRGLIQVHETDAGHTSSGASPLRARALVEWNREARSFLESIIGKGKPTIVMTHWCPAGETINPAYAGNPVNPYFTTECSDLMLGNVTLWVHGHSHMADDRIINETRVIRNPKGYPHEFSGWDEKLIVEMGQLGSERATLTPTQRRPQR